jgi:hypothetical protein
MTRRFSAPPFALPVVDILAAIVAGPLFDSARGESRSIGPARNHRAAEQRDDHASWGRRPWGSGRGNFAPSDGAKLDAMPGDLSAIQPSGNGVTAQPRRRVKARSGCEEAASTTQLHAVEFTAVDIASRSSMKPKRFFLRLVSKRKKARVIFLTLFLM